VCHHNFSKPFHKLTNPSDCVFTDVSAVAHDLNLPAFPILLRNFLGEQLGSSEDDPDEDEDDDVLNYLSSISSFRSAVATFFAPSDICGTRAMRSEWIRGTPS
jgi:hypothetical protein